MIGNFPEPYPDELFYSICARFSERMRYPSGRSIVIELFGSANAIACISLPSHLDHFVAQMPLHSNYSADDIIDNHTLLPLFAPFLPPERLHRLRQDMRGSSGPALHMRAGIMASRVPLPEWLRYCPQCVEDDRGRVGECYWHRIHQVPGVEVCPIHKAWLQNSQIRARDMKTRYEFVSAERFAHGRLLHQHEKDASLLEPLLALTLDIQWLLSQKHLSQDLRDLQQRYKKRLADLEISTHRGRVNRDTLLSRFKATYAPKALDLLNCELDENIEDCWLIRLMHKPENALHPLYHLLLMHSLGLTAESYFQLPAENNPFGDGPWPCLNPTCHYYLQLEVDKCQIKHSPNVSGRPIGTFSCTCGFTYQRTGPDTSAEDRLKINRVKAYGHIWETKLSRLWEDETVSLRQLALQLAVDPLTVKRHAARIGLQFPRPVARTCYLNAERMLRSPKEQILETDILDEYRAKWIKAVEEYPGMGVKFISQELPNIYTWLYRHDPTWLKDHSPSSKQKFKSLSSRLDWQKRDKDLAEQVEFSARRLRERAGRPVRITTSAIGKDIGQLSLLQQHLDKLPTTAQRLKILVETREEFAIRRIQLTTQQYQEEQHYPKRWKFVKRAGVGRLVTIPQVKEALDIALQQLI